VAAWALLALWTLSAAVLPLLHQIGHRLDHLHLPSGAIRYLTHDESHAHDEPHAHDESHTHDESHAHDEAWVEAGLGEEDLRWLWSRGSSEQALGAGPSAQEEGERAEAAGTQDERDDHVGSPDQTDTQDDGPLDHGGAFHFGALALSPSLPALPILYFVLGQQPRVVLGRAECPWRWACPNAARDPPRGSLVA
jgi:hypothetical protein